MSILRTHAILSALEQAINEWLLSLFEHLNCAGKFGPELNAYLMEAVNYLGEGTVWPERVLILGAASVSDLRERTLGVVANEHIYRKKYAK